MPKEQENKAIVGRWFTNFWGKSCNLAIVDEIAALDMLPQYSLHEPRPSVGALLRTTFRKMYFFLLFLYSMFLK